MPMHRVAVFGGGRVGGAIARDLARDADFTVTVVDLAPKTLASFRYDEKIRPEQADVANDDEVERVCAEHDLIIGAVPGAMGFETLRRVIDARKPVVDISFFAQDPFGLDDAARAAGVTAVVDCGIAPGMSNIILGHLDATWDGVRRFACYVGGLPQRRDPPWEYKAPFSPGDVIEEYTRPARLVREGARVTVPALSEIESVEFDTLGTLEAFLTDGLRTLLHTVPVPDMVEKTLRYPGHAARIATLRDAGFFDRTPVQVRDHTVRPLDLTTTLLFEQWRQREDDFDVTAMRITADGTRDGADVSVTYEMVDHWDEASGTSSMARTTGYTCAAVARLVARGVYREPGVSPPEFIGRRQDCYDAVLDHLADRGIRFETKDT